MLARPIHVVAFFTSVVNKSLTGERACQRCNGNCEKEKECLKTTYRKYVYWKWLQKNAGRNLRVNVVLRMSRGQWFRTTEYVCPPSLLWEQVAYRPN